VSREERVARNEASAREINERIEESYDSHRLDTSTNMVCECGLADCDVFLQITKAEYEDVRSDPRRFAIVRAHLVADVEDVVSENDRFVVVEKREGAPARIAERTDPRSEPVPEAPEG
jgi:hypothetical protein